MLRERPFGSFDCFEESLLQEVAFFKKANRRIEREGIEKQ